MLLRKGDYTLFYHFWIENSRGRRQEIDKSRLQLFSTLTKPYGYQVYNELKKWLFPSTFSGLECFELYTLHLGITLAEHMNQNHTKLIKILQKEDAEQKVIGRDENIISKAQELFNTF